MSNVNGLKRAISMMSKLSRQSNLTLLAGLVAVATTVATPQITEAATTATGPWSLKDETGGVVKVALYKSRILELSRPVKKISVGNPMIADILILQAKQVYIVGKALGTTNVVLWDQNDSVINTINLEVTHDLQTLKSKLFQLLPGENIKVHSSQGSIVLGGEVSSAPKMAAAVDLATSFLPLSRGLEHTKGDVDLEGSGVLNLMQVGGSHQVMLEVKVAEISRTVLKELDIQFNVFHSGSNWKLGSVNGGASFPDALPRERIFNDPTPIGPNVDLFSPDPFRISDTGLFGSFLSGDFLFNLAIDAAQENGLAKILAEPTLTTLSGQEAKFISGGEFPIPVPQGDDSVTVEFKEFGIGLQFLPVVLDSGRMSLKINVSVSELSNQDILVIDVSNTNQSFFVPSLRKRSANSTIELNDGQTMGIAGLINESLLEAVEKFPGLGDLPIVGQLFRSQEFRKGQTELVIFVTPRFAKPIAPEMVRLPTDAFVEPTDAEFYILGRMEGQESKAKKTNQPVGTGGADGSFGHGL
jgi:pilus assembly protein CpaC